MRHGWNLIVVLSGIVAGLLWSAPCIATVPPSYGPFPENIKLKLKEDPNSHIAKYGLRKTLERIKANRRAVEEGRITLEQASLTGGIALTGTRLVPVLCGKYSDTGANPYTTTSFQQMLFDGPWATRTMQEYYDEISYGQFTADGTVYGWYQVSQDDTYYEDGNNGLGGDIKFGEFLEEVLDLADGSINFGAYDNDGPDGVANSGDDDGYVDTVMFIQPEAGAECGGGSASNIWSHRSTYSYKRGTGAYTTNDNRSGGGKIKIEDYAVCPAKACGGTMVEIGVFAHEFGHTIGLPDLYDTDDGSEGVGAWCLMGSGSWGGDGVSSGNEDSPSHMGAWAKMELGWIRIGNGLTVASLAEQSITIRENENAPFVLKIYTEYGSDMDEYFLVENRQQIGSDSSLVGTGLLIWHIDDAVTTGNKVENHKLVDLEEADGDGDLDKENNRADNTDPYYSGNARMDADGFTPTSDGTGAGDAQGATGPNSKDYSVANRGIYVTDIPVTSNNMAVTVKTIGLTIRSNDDLLAVDDVFIGDDLRVLGDVYVYGSKAVVKTDNYGTRQVYADESTGVYFFDRGSSQLSNGSVTIYIDPVLLSAVTITKKNPMFIQLTPTSECNGLYVSKKGNTFFTVREIGGGTSNATFNWEIAAKRKGYETDRLERLLESHKPNVNWTHR
jgi:M6 family metalloprotease-like protein